LFIKRPIIYRGPSLTKAPLTFRRHRYIFLFLRAKAWSYCRDFKILLRAALSESLLARQRLSFKISIL
jgi:hypothetical protein